VVHVICALHIGGDGIYFVEEIIEDVFGLLELVGRGGVDRADDLVQFCNLLGRSEDSSLGSGAHRKCTSLILPNQRLEVMSVNICLQSLVVRLFVLGDAFQLQSVLVLDHWQGAKACDTATRSFHADIQTAQVLRIFIVAIT